MSQEVIGVMFAIIGGGIGSLLTLYFQSKKDKSMKYYMMKIEAYNDYLVSCQKSLNRELYGFNKLLESTMKISVFALKNLVENTQNYLESIKNQENVEKQVGIYQSIISEMRKDLKVEELKDVEVNLFRGIEVYENKSKDSE